MDTNAVVANEADVERVLAEQSAKPRPFIGRPPRKPEVLAVWNEAKARFHARKASAATPAVAAA